jgi:hypothetical protein
MRCFFRQLTIIGLAALLAILIVVGGGYLALSWYLNSGELGAKKYYAVLQGVEFENRLSGAEGLLFKSDVNGSGLNAIGIPSRGPGNSRVWVALNIVGPDEKVMAVPEGVPLDIRCEDVRRALGGKQVAEPVRRYLFKECTSG